MNQTLVKKYSAKMHKNDLCVIMGAAGCGLVMFIMVIMGKLIYN